MIRACVSRLCFAFLEHQHAPARPRRQPSCPAPTAQLHRA
jgi:hypothetical protein